MDFSFSVTERLRLLGRGCASMGSPFYAALMDCAADSCEYGGAMAQLIERNKHRARVGLLAAAAAHFRALRGDAPQIAAHFPSTQGDGDAAAAWRAIEQDVRAHETEYAELFDTPVQTNEVSRALPVLGAMLFVAGATGLPLRVFEIGSSAGLILNFDRYRYSGDGWAWGDPCSKLHLRDAGDGLPPFLDAELLVRERRGCDLHPLRPLDPVHAARLLSFIWPDQCERFDRLRAAIAIAREHPVQIDRRDGAAWIAERVHPLEGSATVVLHTVMAEHLTLRMRQAMTEAIEELGERASDRAPVAWVRMESPSENVRYEVAATLWPGRTEQLVARCDGHARRLQWNACVA